MTSSIDRLLAQERATISVLEPAQVAALGGEAVLIDIRPVAQRERHGTIPGALVIERNVLEWRVDPTSDHRHPGLVDHTGAIVVYCQQGYASVLAVAVLQRLGMAGVHDLAGGFDAWNAAGLPVDRP